MQVYKKKDFFINMLLFSSNLLSFESSIIRIFMVQVS